MAPGHGPSESGNMYGSALPASIVPGYWNNLQTMDVHPQITSTVQNENGQREVPRNIRKYGTEPIAHTRSFFEESKKLTYSETSLTKITEALNENSFKEKFHYQKQDLTIENDEEFVNDWPSADHIFSGYSVDLDVHNVNDYSYHTSLNAVNRHSHHYSFGLPNVSDGTYGNSPWNSSFFSKWTCNNYLTGHTFTEPEGEQNEQQGVRDLEEHDWRVRTCVGCQRTKQQEQQQQQERTSHAAPGRARRAPANSSSTSSSSQRPRAASAARPRPPRAPALRSVVSRPGAAPRSAAQRPAARAGPATPRAAAWRPSAWRPATPHAAGVARLSSLRPIALRPPKFSSRPRTAQPAARLAARSAPRHAHLHAPRAAHPTPRFQTRHSTRSSSDDFPTDPRLRSPWYKRRLPYNLLNFLICEELRTLRAMKRARAATDNQARSRPGRSPQQRQERAVAAAGDAQEARDPRRRNDRDVRLRAMERARAARLGASDPRRPRGRGAAPASPPRPFRRPFTDEPVPTAAAGGERTPPRTVPIADEELHDSAPTAVINGVVWRTNKLGDDAVEPGIGVCYRFWSTWVRAAQEEGGAMRAQSFRVREFNLAEARLARHEVTKARRLLRLPPRRLPLAPLPSPSRSPRRPPTAPPRLEAPADAHCCECCRCCTCRNCCACDEVGDCCDRCESCRQVMEKHSRPRSPPPPPPPPPPAQPPPLPAGTRKATPPPPPTSPVKQSVPIVPLLLLSMMVPKKEKSPDPSVSPPAVSPFPLSVWPTLLHSPPAVVPPPQSPVSIPDSISSSLHSQNALDRNQIVPVCPSEVDAQDTFASMPPLPADVFTGEDSSSSSVIIISPPPPAVPRPTTMPHSNEQLRAFPVPAPWPTSLELPFIPLPSGESRVLKKVESVSPQPQRTFASVGFFPENVADIPLPDAPPPPLCNGLSIPLPPRSLLSAPGSSLNNPVESYRSDEGEFLTSSNLVVDMDLDEDSAEEPMIEITENVLNMM